MKVLHIFDSILPSGAETMWTAAVPILREYDVEMQAVSTQSNIGSYANAMSDAGVKVFHLPHNKSAVLFDLKYCVRLFRLVRSERYDAVQIHLEAWRFTNFFVAYLAGVRHITTTIHAFFPKSAIRRIRRPFIMRTMQFFGGKIIAISNSVFQNETMYHYRPLLIWNWIDVLKFRDATKLNRAKFLKDQSLPSDGRIVMVVGNCAPVKNHEFIIKVMKKLPLNYCLVHIGQENESLMHERDVVDALGVGDRVRFLGARTDVCELLTVADVFVACSTREGFGVAPVEALSSGVPTVVSEVPGLIDIKNAIGCHCFSSKLNIDDFAKKILQAAACSRDIVDKGVVAVEDLFSIRKNVEKYLELWRE